MRLLYSSRTLGDVIYREELERFAAPTASRSSTRSPARSRGAGQGYARRIDPELLADVAWPAGDGPLAYVCGPTSLVEAVGRRSRRARLRAGARQDRAFRTDWGIANMEERRLDGNAIGGLLGEVFAAEVTSRGLALRRLWSERACGGALGLCRRPGNGGAVSALHCRPDSDRARPGPRLARPPRRQLPRAARPLGSRLGRDQVERDELAIADIANRRRRTVVVLEREADNETRRRLEPGLERAGTACPSLEPQLE